MPLANEYYLSQEGEMTYSIVIHCFSFRTAGVLERELKITLLFNELIFLFSCDQYIYNFVFLCA